MSTELREQLAAGVVFAEATVDRESGIVRNVSLLGRISQNGRVYTERALGEAAALYRGVQVYLDHPTGREERERGGVRSVRDLAGRVTEAHVAGDRVRGTIQALRGTVPGELLLSLAEQAPEAAGLSHRAAGTTRRGEDGVDVVETVTAVLGLDLVSEPATVAGLFESVQRDRQMWESLVEQKIAAAAFPAHIVGEATRELWEASTEEQVDRWIGDLEEVWQAIQRPTRTSARSVERDPDAGLARRNGRRRWTDPEFFESAERAFGSW